MTIVVWDLYWGPLFREATKYWHSKNGTQYQSFLFEPECRSGFGNGFVSACWECALQLEALRSWLQGHPSPSRHPTVKEFENQHKTFSSRNPSRDTSDVPRFRV